MSATALAKCQRKGKGFGTIQFQTNKLDYSSYNLFYSSDRSRKYAIDELIALFGNSLLSSYRCRPTTFGYPDKIVMLIVTSYPYYHQCQDFYSQSIRLWGYTSKRVETCSFLDSSVSRSASYPESTYIENSLVSEITSMDALVEILELEQDKENVLKFWKTQPKSYLNILLTRQRSSCSRPHISTLIPPRKMPNNAKHRG